MLLKQISLFFLHKNFFVFLFCLFISTRSFAQKIHTYEGAYSLDGKRGNAKFDYYISKKDTIKQGSFSFSFIENVGSSPSIQTVSYTGKFQDNLKDSIWTYTQKKLTPIQRVSENNYKIISSTFGEEVFIQGEFKKGKVDGTWKTIQLRIENSQIVDTTYFFKTSFSEGKMTGKVEGFNASVYFNGYVNNQSRLDGKWTFKHHKKYKNNTIYENRLYNNGILKDHYFVVNRDTFSFNYIGLNGKTAIENWEEIPINSNYFNILKSTNLSIDDTKCKNQNNKPFADSTHSLVDKSNHFVEYIFKSIYNNEDETIWEAFGGSDEVELAKVKLRKNPFTNEEDMNRRNSMKLISNIKEAIENIQNDSEIELTRHSNKKMMYLFKVIKVFQAKVKSIESYMELLSKSTFEYVDREEFFIHLCKDLDYPSFIEFDFKGEKVVEAYPFPESLNNQKKPLSQTKNHLELILKEVNQIEREMGSILGFKKKESKTAEREKVLIKTKDHILSLYNREEEEKFNKYHEKIASQVEMYINEQVVNYAELDLEEKIIVIDSLINCFNGFLKLYERQSEIPQKLNRLNEAYTRTVWNPYTMTDMEERVKEKVYKVFENILHPFYIKDLDNEFNCENIHRRNMNFEFIYRKMMELREQDTRDVEKEIRKVSSPEKILEIFDIKINTKR